MRQIQLLCKQHLQLFKIQDFSEKKKLHKEKTTIDNGSSVPPMSQYYILNLLLSCWYLII